MGREPAGEGRMNEWAMVLWRAVGDILLLVGS
jgi:hypothetical protein